MTTRTNDELTGDEQQAVLAELDEFLRIPSISTLSEHRPDMERAAAWVAEFLRRAGLNHARVIPTSGHPLVYAEWLHAPGQTTILIYGNYDVQPLDPLDAWQSPPFEPTVRDGNLYARGAADDKGQIFIHMKTVERLLRDGGTLPVNVRFLIEGEEETSGKSIEEYVQAHADELACDAVLISDSPMFAPDQPTIGTGLRGALFTELTVTTGRHDVHSGLYGGAAPNAIHALCHILDALIDAEGRITIPGYYDAVRMPSDAERAQWAALPFDETAYREQEIGAPALVGEAGFPVLERTWARPTLDVNGIWGGFTGEGSKAIIPAQASAKVSMRLVPDQEPRQILAAFTRYVEQLCPAEARVTVRALTIGAPVLVDPDTPIMQAAGAALRDVFGKPAVYTRMGGSIPIVSLFMERLHAPTVMLGFGLPDDNLHAPNEKMRLANIYDGIRASTAFLRRLTSAEC
jgi:acetylornithine deacetylase/succinyl-diaminopimelate desuccinylase-like protein